MELTLLRPNAICLGYGVLLDCVFGDPVYPLHPARLMGRALTLFEKLLWRIGANGFAGGIALFLLLTLSCVVLPIAAVALIGQWRPTVAFSVQVFLVYSLLALHDLLLHAWRVERAAGRNDIEHARIAIAQLVGRDTALMDIAACRRAAIESISENLTDGWVSSLFWYVLGGLPLLLLFKMVSTMDSMVGYKTTHYLKFGWCGARLDDLMNWLPARFTWLLLSFAAAFTPSCSARQALQIGWRQHAIIPGPNAGWSEAAIAGAIRRKLIGPIWARGELVTELWLGAPHDPPAASRTDVQRAAILVVTAGILAALLAIGITIVASH
jgi:adenosylcobinamide-phosphate synthase